MDEPVCVGFLPGPPGADGPEYRRLRALDEVVWQSFKTGDQRFDALYDSASSNPDEGREILADPATRERILAMGEIERFTLESRFVR